jgi:hypothetical protein
MHLTKVHLFAILLLALVFCSFFSDNCSGSPLEGFSSGNGNRYSNYGDMYSSNDKFAQAQDALHNRKDKPLDPNYSRANNDNDSDASKSYAPYNSGAGAAFGAAFGSDAGSGQGIPGSQIPPGQDDLYILKSEIVPPVCPACPAMKCDAAGSNGSDGEKKCPPCPPCARCPEPAFECKKVPNYNSTNENAFPRPVLNSFSQFGM